MAITDQLKSLYVKLGGDESTSASNVEEWIDKIEDVAGSDGSGSGGGFMIVDEVDFESENPHLSRTTKDIVAAFDAGIPVFLRGGRDDGNERLACLLPIYYTEHKVSSRERLDQRFDSEIHITASAPTGDTSDNLVMVSLSNYGDDTEYLPEYPYYNVEAYLRQTGQIK